jgi:Tfp pilus assembly protein PilX
MRFPRLKNEQGMVLPIALGILAVLTISTIVVIDSSSSNARSSTRSKGDKLAFALAEAGINNAVAVLSKNGNDNMHQTLLPACKTGSTWTAESTWKLNDGAATPVKYEGGDSRWCGTFDAANAVWNVTARGIVRNPYGTRQIRRELSAVVPIVPIEVQPLVNQSWNYMFATRTGTASGCDLTFSNNATIGTNVYAMGNLCLDNNVTITAPKAIVLGKIQIGNNGAIGQSGTNNWSTRVEVQVGGAGGQFCKYATGSWTTISSSPFCGDPQHVYSKNSTSSAMTVNPTPTSLVPPNADWNGWYQQAIPGPKQACTFSSGTVPVFDGNTVRDNSISTVFDLTPTSSSYSCRVGPSNNPLGEVTWNHSTKVLTVHGTIFIDGSVKMVNTGVIEYSGYATFYVSGTFLMDNGAKLCAQKNAGGTDCDFTGWDPNTEMMSLVANGDGSIAGAQSQAGSTGDGGGNSILLNNNARWQGAMMATKALQLSNNSKIDGPTIGSTVVVDNNVVPDAFPTITQVPAGMPGNNTVFAQTQSPRLFSG